jgi:hypothetical protein
VKARSRLPWEDPGRDKPKGAASGLRANPAMAARDSREGRSPETGACRAGSPLRRWEHRQVKRYVGASSWRRGGTS